MPPSSPSTPRKGTEAAGAAATKSPTPRTLSEVIINAYSLRDFTPAYNARVSSIVNSSQGDVTFSTPHDTPITTFSALFSVAAAAKGRPGIAVERFGKNGRVGGVAIGEILNPGEGEEGVGEKGGDEKGKGKEEEGSNDNGEDGKRKKVVKCYDEGFAHVKRVYNHVVTKPGEQMDRLLDEALKGGKEGYVANPSSGDFVIELEAEEEEVDISVPIKAPRRRISSGVGGSGGRTWTTMTRGKKPVGGREVKTTKASKPPPPQQQQPQPTPQTAAAASEATAEQQQSGYAEIHLHRFILLLSIPYYKYLDHSALRFSDTLSNSSVLPYPTVTFFALRVIQRWLYNPLRIGEVLEEFDPNAHAYLLSNCKRQDRNGYPPPLATAKGVIEVARAADYLGIQELSGWCDKILRKMCHGLHRCGGGNCRVMIPFILDEVYKSGGGGVGLDGQLKEDIKVFLARNVESMWKRPVVMLNDAVLAELVEVFKGLHRGCGVPAAQNINVISGVANKKKKRLVKSGDEAEDVVTKPLHWWHLYLELNRVRVSVMTSASGNATRWMEKLLGPTMEHCVHEVARGFNDPRLAADLQSKLEDGSFQKDVVVQMLMMVTMSSVFGGGGGGSGGDKEELVDIPFEKPPLTRKTVKAVFEGIVNLRTWDGRDGEWGRAEKRVVDFLAREWLTIVADGEGRDGKSGFSSWRPAMLTVLSRKLRVSTDDLLGKGQRKGLPAGGSSSGISARTVKDSLGNDVLVDTRNLRRTDGSDDAAAAGPSRTLRPEAEAFVPAAEGV